MSIGSTATRIAFFTLPSFALACGGEKPVVATPTETATEARTPAAPPAAPEALDASAPPAASAPSGADGGAPGAPKAGPAVTWKGVGFSTPESVTYDPAQDLYFVSNIGGQPLETDDNGFISQLTPDGQVKALKFIASGKGSKLNAPKGLAIAGDLLYVSDITTVRMFDKKTGEPKGEVKVPGSTFLNDLAVGAGGTVYVTDSGLKANKEGKFEPSGSDAVWAIDSSKKLTKVAKSKDLKNPNGLLFSGGKVWVNTFGDAEIFSIGPKGERADVTKLPSASLDGFAELPGGDFLVSSWDADVVYRGKPGGTFTVAIPNVKDPADIGYDSKRGRVLVPLFSSDAVEAYDLK